MSCYLVTGGAGFIGSHLVALLLQSGHRVLVLDALTYAANPLTVEEFKGHKNFYLLHGSVGDTAILQQAFEFAPDGIFHLAAESHVDRSIDNPEVFIQTNVVGTYKLLEASLLYWRARQAKGLGFRLLHVSTDEVFGSLGPSGLFSESSPYNPSSPYSASKASADHLVRAYHQTYGLPVVITNCSNNYGSHQFPEKLIPHMILCCLQNLPLPVYGTGDHRRDWLYVDDHCQGLMAAMAAGQDGQTYLFGSGQEHNTLAIVQNICKAMDELMPRSDGTSHATRIVHVPDRPGHDWRCAIDATRSQVTLSWRPRMSLMPGLAQTVRWYLKNHAWVETALTQGYKPARQGTR